MINGVIFDMDGLMFDTERMWATFWEPALAALGLEYKEGLAEAERGTAGETSRNIVRQFYGEDCDANAIIDSLHSLVSSWGFSLGEVVRVILISNMIYFPLF